MVQYIWPLLLTPAFPVGAQAVAALFPIHLPADVPGKVAFDNISVWTCATRMGDSDGDPDSGFILTSPGYCWLLLAVVGCWAMNH